MTLSNLTGASVQQNKKFITAKPSRVLQMIRICFDAGIIPFLWGDPGVGKTWMVGQIAAMMFGRKGDPAEQGQDTDYFRKLILSQTEPSDCLGVPVITPGAEGGKYVSVFSTPHYFDLPEEWRGVFFLDELAQAGNTMQAPGRQLLTERRFGPHKLPKGALIAGASNYPHNRTGANAMLPHARSAVCHINVLPDLDDFIYHGVGIGLREEIIGALRWKPEMFHAYNPDEQAFPCARTWLNTSKLMNQVEKSGAGPDEELALYAGEVGIGQAYELLAYLEHHRALPDLDEIEQNPTKVPVPHESQPAARFAVAAALSRRMNKKNAAAFITYLERLPKAFQSFAVRDALVREAKDGKRDLRTVKAVGNWAYENNYLLT